MHPTKNPQRAMKQTLRAVREKFVSFSGAASQNWLVPPTYGIQDRTLVPGFSVKKAYLSESVSSTLMYGRHKARRFHEFSSLLNCPEGSPRRASQISLPTLDFITGWEACQFRLLPELAHVLLVNPVEVRLEVPAA